MWTEGREAFLLEPLSADLFLFLTLSLLVLQECELLHKCSQLSLGIQLIVLCSRLRC